MRIALIYDAIFPYIKGGGERYFYELSRQLGKRHEVHLIGMKYWPGPSVQQVHPGVWAHGVCRAMSFYKKGKKRRRSLSQALWFAFRHPWSLLRLGRFDLIDCMSTPYFALYSARLAAAIKRTPLVSSWLEIWRGDSWQEYLGRVGGAIARRIEHVATRLPRHIIAISEHTREGLEECGVPPERISVIMPGIHWGDIQAIEPGERGADILFAGRLIEEKRAEVLIEAVARVRETRPEVSCLIIGDGPERPRLEALADRLGVRGHVQFAGFIPDSTEVYRAMKASKVFVLPSQREGFGIVVVEAAACGLPVVTVDHPNNASAYLVRSGEIGSVCSLEPQDIADGVFAILKNEDNRKQMAASAVEWSKQFDWPSVAERVEAIYQQASAAGKVRNPERSKA